jgi:hypothetical protein
VHRRRRNMRWRPASLESKRKLELSVPFCYRPMYVLFGVAIDFFCIVELVLHFIVDCGVDLVVSPTTFGLDQGTQ